MIRTIEIENIYELYEPKTTAVIVELRTPDEFDSMDDYTQYLDDALYPHTGTGRTKGNSAYFARSVDGLAPYIEVEWC